MSKVGKSMAGGERENIAGVVTRSRKLATELLSNIEITNTGGTNCGVKKNSRGGVIVDSNLASKECFPSRKVKVISDDKVNDFVKVRVPMNERTNKRDVPFKKTKALVESVKIEALEDKNLPNAADNDSAAVVKTLESLFTIQKSDKSAHKSSHKKSSGVDVKVRGLKKKIHKGSLLRRSERIGIEKQSFKEAASNDDYKVSLDGDESVKNVSSSKVVWKKKFFSEKNVIKGGLKPKSSKVCTSKIDSDPEFKADTNEVSSDSEVGIDWEDVPDAHDSAAKRKKTHQPIHVTVSKKPGSKKSKLEQAMDEIRRRINRKLMVSQNNVHKVHLLCLVSLGFRMNTIGSNEFFKAILLSCVPLKTLFKIAKKSFNLDHLTEVRDWFLKAFPLEIRSHPQDIVRLKLMADVMMLGKKCLVSELEYILMFIILCRSLGLNSRIVFSLQPTTYKANDTLKSRPLSIAFLKKMNLIRDVAADSQSVKKSNEEQQNMKSVVNNKSKKMKKSKSDVKEEDYEDDEDSDDEFVDVKPKKRKSTSNAKSGEKLKKCDAAFLMTQTSRAAKGSKKQSDTCDWWAEIYVKSLSSWITVAGPSLSINEIEEVEKRVSKPISYILAFDNENHVKDLTRKYDSNWLKKTSKLRLNEGWWCDVLKHFADDGSDESLEEDIQIHDALLKKPFPTTVSEYKNHPLYALQRHLLRYEAIYPPTSVILGRLKNNEPIYARECVHTLCSREKWLIEGKMVLPDQEPYKYVKALPKSGKVRVESNEMLGLYGSWQTELYIGPPAVDGIVPKNRYGNVDLFKPWMLPQGTVHLKGTFYGMGKAARKVGIDAAPAMVGWEFHKGLNHPILDGWVVCKENMDDLLEAWRNEQKLDQEKEKYKKEKRVIANWMRLVKHLVISNKLRNRPMSIDGIIKKETPPFQGNAKYLDSDSGSCSSFLAVSGVSVSSKQNRAKVRGERKATKRKNGQ